MIFIANDHAGINLKNHISKHLESKNIPFINLGVDTCDSVDYPDIAAILCKKVTEANSGDSEILNDSGNFSHDFNEKNIGILICGSGIGMSIAANRHKSIRAALCNDSYSAIFARRHNDANVLCLGERVVGVGLALSIVDVFLGETFEGGRHEKRVQKL